ncbi:RNA-directed DNA polymerase, eukaryota [Tanacetum coccineum]
MTKPDTEWKSCKRQGQSKAKDQISQSQSQLNKSTVKTKAVIEEYYLAVWDCGVNKSPGPDGFTFEFFRKFWKVIGPDFCEAVEHFFKQGSFFKGCNSSFIALIPKVLDAKFVNDYRPISLIGCIYKVVTKILASRLAMVIAGLVSNTQSAFVAGRQMLDGPFILNEVLDWCKRKKKKALFFKVDFAKAYDSVRWDFLLDVLEAFGFECLSHLDLISFLTKCLIGVEGSSTLSICRVVKAVDEDVFERHAQLRALWLYLIFVFCGVTLFLDRVNVNSVKGASMLEKKNAWIAWDKVLAREERVRSSWDKIDSHSVRKVSMYGVRFCRKCPKCLSRSGFDFSYIFALRRSGMVNILVFGKRLG